METIHFVIKFLNVRLSSKYNAARFFVVVNNDRINVAVKDNYPKEQSTCFPPVSIILRFKHSFFKKFCFRKYFYHLATVDAYISLIVSQGRWSLFLHAFTVLSTPSEVKGEDPVIYTHRERQ